MKLLKSKEGFTLAEVVVAVMLGTLGLTYVAYAMTQTGYLLGRDNRANMYSLNAIREEMDDLRTASFDSLVTGTFSNAQLSKIQSAVGTVTVTNGSTFSLGDDIKKVTVAAAWTGNRGQAMVNSVTTLITRTGINSNNHS